MKKNPAQAESVRLDKWLFVARFYKTRALATAAIRQGKVLYNDQKPNPSRDVTVGAILCIQFGDLPKTVTVKALAITRKSATLALTLYEETPESKAKQAQYAAAAKEKRLFTLSAPLAPKRPQSRDRKRMRNIKRTKED